MASKNLRGYDHFGSRNIQPRYGNQTGQFRPNTKAVEGLKTKEPDQIIFQLFNTKFGLENYLNVGHMEEKLLHDFTFVLVKSFECNSMPTKLRELSTKIVESNFFKSALYNSIKERINFGCNINLIRLIIKLLIELLHINEYNYNLISAMRDRVELVVMHRIPNEDLRSLFGEFLHFEKYVLDKMSKKQNKTFQNVQNDDGEPDDGDFTTMSIVPSLDDISDQQETFLRKNITNGSYKSVHHYLDVQFRLLREDFMRPLRDGISQLKEIVQKYKKGSALTTDMIRQIKKIQNLSAYFDVHCINVATSGHGIVYVMQLDKEKVKLINWETSKRLIYGSLICFSSDYFSNECLIGIVCERNEKDLREKGCFNVKFDFEENYQISYPEFGKAYIMLETTAFFESYKYVLKALKTFKREGEENFPFKENLVYCQNSEMPIPNYLKDAFVEFKFGSIDEKWRNREDYLVSDPDSWPSAKQMNLDQSQYEAIKLALTNKLALIQGPPGTGKTFLGVKLVKFLLDNKHTWWNSEFARHRPILMICYTNHALDQFLEHCINECKLKEGVVRIGGQSSSRYLEPFLLKNIRKTYRYEYIISHSFRNQSNLISSIQTKIDEASKSLDLIHNFDAIISFEKIKKFMSLSHVEQFDTNFDYKLEDINFVLLEWLGILDLDTLLDEFHKLGISEKASNRKADESVANNKDDKEPNYINENNNIQEFQDRNLDDNFYLHNKTKANTETSDLIKFDNLKKLVKKYRETCGQEEEDGWKIRRGKKVVDAELDKLETSLKKILAKTSSLYSGEVGEQIENESNIWKLNYVQRHLLYFHWINKYRIEKEQAIVSLSKSFNIEATKLQELNLQQDRSIMQDAYIIAMTTTGSSRYHSVLKDICPRIVIVEEAAEVFEAHIVSALSKHCEHLVLIGDHVQLRPNPAVYTLATQYHLDVSLFERLVRNNAKRVMLNNQHRMRPEISNLMKHFYQEDIFNDHSVNLYPSIKGLKKNIFFIDHDRLEKRSVDNTTKSNVYEAEYLAKLSWYLVKQGYLERTITVLTMYLGQLNLIRKQLRALNLNSIKVSTVDNYQGEENNIILLSLVRSNTDGKIEFLNIKNRVCVALSRAKHGLYVIGNFEFISQSEIKDTWKKLLNTIKSDGYFGRSLSLTCGSHPDNDIDVLEPDDFDKRPSGGCFLPCNFRLDCGHVCAMNCHGNYDQEHVLYECRKNCDKKIERCGHLCKEMCSSKHVCNKCDVPMEKEIKECGHMVKLRCDIEPSRMYCEFDCEKILSCGHRCTRKCYEVDCDECLTKVNVQSPCVHKSTLTVNCSDPKWTYVTKCEVPCDKTLDCGHKCSGTCGSCYGGLIHKNCNKKCDRMLFCGHKCSVPCSRQCEPCQKQCANECVHSKCMEVCSKPCAECLEKCPNSCVHSECTRLCHELCDRKPCDEPCEKKLVCGHKCIGLCGEICPPLCRICDQDEVCQIEFGNEDEPDARFVLLNDCKHLIESSAMDYWISSRYSDQENSIQLPECPKCKTPIKKSKRYSNVIKKQLKAINEIKSKHFGDKAQNKKIFEELLMQFLNHKFSQFSKNDQFIKINLKNELKEGLSFNSLAAIENTWNVYLRIIQIEKIIKDNGLMESRDQWLFLKFEIDKIYDALKTNDGKLFMLKDGQKLTDISFELERVASIVELERMKNLSKKIPDLPDKSFDGLSKIENLLISNIIRFDEIGDTVKSLFSELAPLLRTELTKEEKLMIVSAIGLSIGHWYKCPNGHVYCIGECGGAMEKSICPDCKAEIGGENHRVVRGNELASEMDGATHPAWPTNLI